MSNFNELDFEVLERLQELGEEFDAELTRRMKDRGLPTADQILSGMIVSIKEELSFPVQQMLIYDFCRELDKVEPVLLAIQFDRMLIFIIKHFQPEMVAFTIKTYLEGEEWRVPKDSKMWKKYADTYYKLVPQINCL